MNIGEKEIAAMDYEFFIRRAFKCGYNEHGASADYFRILADTVPNYKGKIPPSFDKQLENVIDNLNKAIDKFLISFKLTAIEQVEFNKIRQRLNHADSAEVISDIVHDCIELTQRFKDF